MKKLVSVLLLSGLICSPFIQAKTSAKPAQPKCAQGKLVSTLNDDGLARRDYHYYRCLLKQDQNGYLVQDFYWPSAKKQMEPVIISKAGLTEWDTEATGVTGRVLLWYENGQQKLDSEYRDGKPTGPWVRWYDNGQKKQQGQHSDGKAIGGWTFWHSNGQKKAEGQFVDGEQSGEWHSWYENGQQLFAGQYLNGEPDGAVTIWHENGQKESEQYYRAGQETGLWQFWHDNGRKAAEIQYKDGLPGDMKAWDEDGKEIDPLPLK